MSKESKEILLTEEEIEPNIYIVRGERVMLDQDLARLYGVETKVLNQAVRRNIDRFPENYMFQLSKAEFSNLKSQFVTSSWGGRRKKPKAFTEHGTVMLASVLKSKRAIQMNIEIINAFVRFRRMLSSQENTEKQLSEIRSYMLKQSNKNDREFRKVWNAIEDLTKKNEEQPASRIGFRSGE